MRFFQKCSCILAVFLSTCNSIEQIDASKTIIFNGTLYKIDKDEPFTGVVYNNYPSGQKEYEGLYRLGKPNGQLAYWYENGSIMKKGNIKNGLQTGRWTYFNENGTVKKIIDY